jgi:hypothetical protein
MVILSPLGATAFWFAIVLRLEREITGARNYPKHSSPKNRLRANDDLGLEPVDFRGPAKLGFDDADALGCKPKRLCFNHGEET